MVVGEENGGGGVPDVAIVCGKFGGLVGLVAKPISVVRVWLLIEVDGHIVRDLFPMVVTIGGLVVVIQVTASIHEDVESVVVTSLWGSEVGNKVYSPESVGRSKTRNRIVLV